MRFLFRLLSYYLNKVFLINLAPAPQMSMDFRLCARLCEASTCVRSVDTGPGFGLESLRLQIEVRAVRAGLGDGDRRG